MLFVDVVDSTRVAAEVGDARWRELVAAFRTTVRRQLKRLSGHEVDTAGDGFFATFDTPASALRAAAAIVADVQSIGLDVRCGLHTGELERIDGRLGGIAAHIGARVMAHADAAQVLTTGTVRDLVVGGAMAFEPVGDFELKGVPGTWALHRLTSVDRIALPVALAAEVAASRRANRARPSTRGRPVLVGAVAATAIAVAAIAVYAGTRPDPSGAAASTAPPSASGSANASASPEPIALVRIDPGRREIAQIVPGEWDPGLGGLIASNGNLWYGNETTLIPLDPSTGERREPFELPPETYKVDPADGSLWVGHGMDRFQTVVDRLDPLSYRNLGQIDPGEEVWDHVVTNRAIYMVTRGEGESGVSEVLELDPSTGELKDRDPTFVAAVHRLT